MRLLVQLAWRFRQAVHLLQARVQKPQELQRREQEWLPHYWLRLPVERLPLALLLELLHWLLVLRHRRPAVWQRQSG